MKKNKIRITGCIVLLLWVMVLAQYVVTKGFKSNMSIMEAFSTEEKVIIETCSNEIIGRTDEGIAQADRIIKEIMWLDGCYEYKVADISKSLGLDGICKKAEASDSNKTTTITMTGYKHSANTYIHYKSEGADISEAGLEKVKEYCDSNGIEYAVYRKICGVAKGYMYEEERRGYAKKIFERMGAEIIEEHYDTDYIAYGYSVSLPDAVESGGKKINMQIMISNNEVDKTTEICVGTPILSE